MIGEILQTYVVLDSFKIQLSFIMALNFRWPATTLNLPKGLSGTKIIKALHLLHNIWFRLLVL